MEVRQMKFKDQVTLEERLGKSVRETILQALRNEGVNADETSATIDLIAELEQYMDQPMIAELVFDAILKARV
jgi:proline dehydrogenase